MDPNDPSPDGTTSAAVTEQALVPVEEDSDSDDGGAF